MNLFSINKNVISKYECGRINKKIGWNIPAYFFYHLHFGDFIAAVIFFDFSIYGKFFHKPFQGFQVPLGKDIRLFFYQSIDDNLCIIGIAHFVDNGDSNSFFEVLFHNKSYLSYLAGDKIPGFFVV